MVGFPNGVARRLFTPYRGGAGMECHEAVNRLERLRRSRPKLGTDTTAALLAALGDPHDDLDAVQITGLNGKGSTTRVLREQT